MQKITPFLWFDGQAEEAANFYVSIFKDSKIDGVSRSHVVQVSGDVPLTDGHTLGRARAAGSEKKISRSVTIDSRFAVFRYAAHVFRCDDAMRSEVCLAETVGSIRQYPQQRLFDFREDCFQRSFALRA